MDDVDQLTNIVFWIIKIGLVLFALAHFFIGLLLYRQNIRMRKVISTNNAGFLTLFSFINIVILLLVLLLVIIVPI